MRAMALALRILGREWRSGDLAVLFLALFVAVASLTGVSFLVDRIDRGMQLQANEVLGADLRLQSPDPIDTQYEDEAHRRGLSTARLSTTLSVVLKGDATQLANVVAVSEGYPLRGQVAVAERPFGPSQVTRDVPAPGELWGDSRLLAALQAQVGDVVTVGAIELRVGNVLISRPDQGSGFVDLSPSLLMNLADLPATELIQPGSRVRNSVLFAGDAGVIAPFAKWLVENRTRAERLRDIAEASPEVNNAATRSGRFLQLASLASVLLCAVAIAMTARRYVKRHLDIVALMKTLGASQSFVLGISLTQLVCIALLAALLGALAGFLVHQGLLSLVKDLLETELPAASWRPAWLGLISALLLLTGFALPSVLQLARVPAIRILRRDIGPPPLAALLAFGPAALAVALLILSVTREWNVALGFLGGLVALSLALAGAGLGLVKLAARARGGAGVAWRFGIANLARRRAESIVQIISLGLGLSALLLLAVIRGDLVEDWRASLPDNAPNFFFVNIPPEDREPFEQYLNQEGGSLSRILPMIRGRMTQINGVPVGDITPLTPRGEGHMQREQNLTWAAQIGPDNVITEGHWFTEDEFGQPLVSVATDFQESIGLKIGDRLQFDIAGETVDATIGSFRRIQWDSLQPNFFLMFPPDLLEGAAGTYMASANFRPSEPAVVAELVRRFPSVSIFDMDDLLAQIRSLVNKGVLAVQSVFLFTLLAGTVVLLAAVQSTRDERRYESAMLRTLGAKRGTVLAGVLIEFALLGLIAGLLAAATASIGGYVIALRLLDVPYTPNPALWAAGVVVGVVLVCAAGWLATRSALSRPPLDTLRHG
ncbi:MAG: FtsX-like permease family protein [Nevskiaceae bacterium]|nr:FtsX-like permease family protein [Nevskiaceae bacterium]